MTEATGPSSVTDAVLDASVIVRAVVDGHADAMAWLGAARGALVCWWPALLYLEVANALLQAQRSRLLAPTDARALLSAVRAIPARSVPLERLVEEALAVAAARDLSVYDGSYVVLSETVGAPLVTADRRLAAATANAVLISP